MIDLDKFSGPSDLRVHIVRSCWGHGEYGYELSLFSSHEKAEVEKAKKFLEELLSRTWRNG